MRMPAVGSHSRRPHARVPVGVWARRPGPQDARLLSGAHAWPAPDLPSASCRPLLSLREAPAGEALPHLPTAQQLVLHLPEAHLPVPGGPGEPLFR